MEPISSALTGLNLLSPSIPGLNSGPAVSSATSGGTYNISTGGTKAGNGLIWFGLGVLAAWLIVKKK